jgi:hypothetical protein
MRTTFTLRDAWRIWITRTSPKLLLGGLAIGVVLRVLEGPWTLRDTVVAGIIVALQPVSEWLIHVYVLHWRPRVVRGRTLDPYAARSHRWHHQDPKDLSYLFIHPRVVQGFLAIGGVLHVLAFTVRPSFGTAAVTSLALTTTYEWTHYLIHSDYQPRTRFYRGLWRAHRLHHYRNENYWYGVTSHLGDRLLRTYPGKDDVPLSPTATTLAQLEPDYAPVD